jgi:hypothetical protein
MSIDTFEYFGAYLKLKRIVGVVEKSANSCANMACKRFFSVTDAKFCPECGGPIMLATVEEPIEYGWDHWSDANDVYEDTFSRMSFYGIAENDTHDFLFPNTSKGNAAEVVSLSNENGHLVQFNGQIDSAVYIEKFREIYKDILNALTASKMEYEIEFGIAKTYY